MKEEILLLRQKGLSYKKIASILNCAKSTVAYHSNNSTKEKTRLRGLKRRQNNIYHILEKKVSRFINTNTQKLRTASSDFGRGAKRDQKNDCNFRYKDVINKFGIDTKCYLTGDPINLLEDTYQFDHIIPTSKGGSNNLDNLGITTKASNQSKSDMSVDEYIEHCKKVLTNFGYRINKDI